MSKPFVTEVIVSASGVVVIGSRGPRTRVWFRVPSATRFYEVALTYDPPTGSPAALLPDGRLLVVGRKGESMLLREGRSPNPGPVLRDVTLDGVSSTLVAFAPGPRLFRYAEGAWVDESPAAPAAGPRTVAAVGDGFAVGADGDCWVAAAGGWKKTKVKTTASLRCAAGAWAGGEGVVLERLPKSFRVHEVTGTVSAICPWKKGALLVIGGALFDLEGARVKAPAQCTSIGSHGDFVALIANGSLYESTDAKRWTRKALPKMR